MMIKAPTRFRRFCARLSRTSPRVYCGEPPAGVTRVRADAGQVNRGGRVVGRAGGPARPGSPAMSHPVHALTLTFLGCPAAAPPRASSSRQRSRGRSRRSRSSNHRGVGDFHHPGLLASRLSALWVEGPTRRSTDLSFWASPAWRAHFLLLAGRARNTDGTHPRASSGARSVVSGPFPEVLPPAWRRASSACDRTDPTERSWSRPGRRWGRRHAAPRNLGRAGRAFAGPPNRWGIH